MKTRGLGKGLSALLREEVVAIEGDEFVKLIAMDTIQPSSDQPRKNFEIEKIQELADSISSNGLLQPIIVCPVGEEKYKIVAGERRWRACKIINMDNIPAIVKNLNEKEILEVALVENMQREGLSAIEEAEGLERLIKEFNYTQDRLATAVGKSRSHVANLLRLTQLPKSVKDKINYSLISMGHARCLVGHMDAEKIAQLIIDKDLTVRQTESLVRNWAKQGVQTTDEPMNNITRDYEKENDFRLLAQTLSEKFGIKITIETSAYGGKVVFHYTNLEQLDSILVKLN